MATSAPFEIIRIPLQDLATSAAADQALVAHYQAAGVNAAPVMVQRDDLAYSVIEGHQTVAAMKAAGLTWCWCLVIDASYEQERDLITAAAPQAAPEAIQAAPEAAPEAPQARKGSRETAAKAPRAKTTTVKELKAKAKARGLRGYSRMSKAQLVALLG